jgi:hypothetical protein
VQLTVYDLPLSSKDFNFTHPYFQSKRFVVEKVVLKQVFLSSSVSPDNFHSNAPYTSIIRGLYNKSI